MELTEIKLNPRITLTYNSLERSVLCEFVTSVPVEHTLTGTEARQLEATLFAELIEDDTHIQEQFELLVDKLDEIDKIVKALQLELNAELRN